MPVVSGQVRTRDGKPIKGARVSFTSAPVALPDIAVLSDAGGAFALSAPVAGAYRIMAVTDRSGTAERTVQVGGGPVTVNLQLGPE